jgi:hypothetical protein
VPAGRSTRRGADARSRIALSTVSTWRYDTPAYGRVHAFEQRPAGCAATLNFRLGLVKALFVRVGHQPDHVCLRVGHGLSQIAPAIDLPRCPIGIGSHEQLDRALAGGVVPRDLGLPDVVAANPEEEQRTNTRVQNVPVLQDLRGRSARQSGCEQGDERDGERQALHGALLCNSRARDGTGMSRLSRPCWACASGLLREWPN